MKVEHSNVDKLIQNRSEAANAVEQNLQRAAELPLDGHRKDEAALSERAQTLSRARTQFEEIPEVRDDKVQALREKVNAGEYEVDVNKLAARIKDLFELD
jgi:flagellar biosynthesis anti-sigma factor FlgM